MSITSLIGMMYAGKSSVAEELSVISGRNFFDTDQIIEEQGMSITEIFAIYGERYFRRIEYQVISDLIANNNNYILAVGGGAFLQQNTRDLLLENTQTVWLKVTYETLLQRMGDVQEDKKRPLAGLINKECVAKRNKIYEQASIHVDCNGVCPVEISKIIRTLIQGRS